MILAVLNLGAGLALCGLFVGNVLTPTTNVTNPTSLLATESSNLTSLVTVGSSTTTAPFICAIIDETHDYKKCLAELEPLRDLCLDNCSSETVVCENACFSKYGTDLSSCPCQVSSHFKNVFLCKTQKFCQPGCPCPEFDCLSKEAITEKLSTTQATTTIVNKTTATEATTTALKLTTKVVEMLTTKQTSTKTQILTTSEITTRTGKPNFTRAINTTTTRAISTETTTPIAITTTSSTPQQGFGRTKSQSTRRNLPYRLFFISSKPNLLTQLKNLRTEF